jgi:hypothetical protein
MTANIFFWYVFPLIVAAGAFGWIAYDRHNSRNNHMHPANDSTPLT